jgi:toxin ParE1/3/4
MKVRWTTRAFRDLSDIHAYIFERDPLAALKAARTIRAQVETLSDHPLMGHPGRVKGTRELNLVGQPYLIAYRIGREAVEILAIRHTARRWPDISR